MSHNRIKLTGLTPSNKIPEFIYNSPHNEVPQSFKLNLSKNRPGIKKIISLDVKINVKSYKNLITSSFNKIVINAVKHVELVYYSQNNTVHKAKFNLPFDMQIILNECKFNIQKILTYVTKLSIKKINPKSFYLNSTVVVASLLENKNDKKVCNEKINTQSNYRKTCSKKIIPSKLEKPTNLDYCGDCYYDNYWNFAYLLILVLIVLRNFCVFPAYF